MKITQIRQGVFETNSSSTHSITIGSSNYYIPDITKLNIQTGEYGWEIETYYDLNNKASYALTYAVYVNPLYIDMLRDVILDAIPNCIITYNGLEYDEFLEKVNNADYFELGYIDHQSFDDVGYVFNSYDNLYNFLFSTDSYFETDNDNH